MRRASGGQHPRPPGLRSSHEIALRTQFAHNALGTVPEIQIGEVDDRIALNMHIARDALLIFGQILRREQATKEMRLDVRNAGQRIVKTVRADAAAVHLVSRLFPTYSL